MSKFKKFGGVAQWDKTMKDLIGHILHITSLTPVRTSYGPTYVATCDISFDGKEAGENVAVLIIGKVAFEQLESYLSNIEGKDNPYPFDVLVAKVERKGNPDYWVLDDPYPEED